ncbi:MAG: S8/S53 family peptidase, partial [Lentisphaeria bacterium]|nr:S8/S53 family peptidase [Lentisphaeria bacterium]
MKTSVHLLSMVLLSYTGLAAMNCSSEVADDGEHNCVPPISITVAIDESLQPYAASLPGINGGPDRRLGAVSDENDTLSSFVTDEVVLSFDSDEELDAFLEDTGGEVLAQIDPAENGLPDLAQMALIRVDTDGVDTSSLADDIASSAQADGEGGDAALRFSSEASARLMALAMGKRKVGLAVGVNFVAPFQAIPDSTEEAPNTTTPQDDHWDAYGWDGWSLDGALGIGVPEAWSLLHYAGKTNNKVKIAIIDGGFSPNEDFPTWTSVGVYGGSGLNQENPNDCTGGSSCPWHGMGVASTAMALPDNQFGWAGTGGPVATGVFIQTGGGAATANLALIKAGNRNPKIINMSLAGKVNWSLRASLSYFENTTERLRDRGILIFACSGNNGEDVDTSTCLGDYCWEDRFYFPCENTGV